MSVEIQTFKNEKSTLTAIRQAALGLGIIFLMTAALKSFVPGEYSAACAALFLIGSAAVFGYVYYNWRAAEDFTVTVNLKTGFTICRSGSVESYRWKDIIETELVADKIFETGVSSKAAFYIYTATSASGLKFPQTMENFHLFLDAVNQATPHLPYTWECLVWQKTNELDLGQNWFRNERKFV